MAARWWVGVRNRLLASARFQRLTTRFPLTRPLARRHARRLFDLVAGFTYSQTLLACVQLGLFTRLADGPAGLSELAAATDLPRAALDRLVIAAAALNLLDRLPDDQVALGSAGAALVGNPGVLAMIAHHPRLYADLADPVALLRRGGGGGALAAFWAYAPGGKPQDAADYSALMAASQPPVAALLLDAYDFSRHRRLLDVGGGEGIFLAAVAARVPKLALGWRDLPSVEARARARLGSRATFHPGDFFTDPLPAGYDLISLVRVLHDHDDPQALALLRAIRAALAPGGRLLIGEPMIAGRATAPVGATYFGLYLLAMGSGRARTPREIGSLLDQAGFVGWRKVRTAMPLVTGALVAMA